MGLSARTRALLALGDGLQRIGVLPTLAKAAGLPVDQRIGGKPLGLLVGPLPEGITIEDRTAPGRDGGEVEIRVYRPAGGGRRPGLVYFHGGGWVTGGVLACEHICMRVAADADVVVVSVAYRLAPDHPFPAGLHDCADAVRWVVDNATRLGIDASRFAVGGDSAGGNLAAAVTLADPPPLAGLVLVYPALDFTRSTPSAREYAGPGVTADDLRIVVPLYLGDSDPADPLCSPLLAEDLRGFPPTLVITAEYDPLRDEGRLFAARLQDAGVPVRLTHFVQYVHGFFATPRMYPGIEQAWAELTGWVRRTLHDTP